MKKMLRLGLSMLILLLVAAAGHAIPTPKGIDGIIREPSGSEVTEAVQFSINNTANSFYVAGTTGYGSVGRYSAAVRGANGDSIEIRAWSGSRVANRTVTLQGVMRGVDLTLPDQVLGLQSSGSRASVQTHEGYTISLLPDAHILYGTVYDEWREQVAAGTPYSIVSESGAIVKGVTGIGPFSGRFAAVVDGNEGDKFQLSVGGKSVGDVAVSGDTVIDVMYDGERFIFGSPNTGFGMWKPGILAGILGGFLLVGILYVVRRK